MKRSGIYSSTELAKVFNVSPSSIKNWSEEGLLGPVEKTPGGHRRYTDLNREKLAELLKCPTAPVTQPSAAAEASDATQR